MKNKNVMQLALISSVSIITFPTFADGYINENMIIFTSIEDADQDPWKDHPQCLAKTTVTAQKGIFENQYTYQNGTPLTSIFKSTEKAKKTANAK